MNAAEKVKGGKNTSKPKDPKDLEMKELQKDIKGLLGFDCLLIEFWVVSSKASGQGDQVP